MSRISEMDGIRSGDNTQNHDQVIAPASLAMQSISVTKNTTNEIATRIIAVLGLDSDIDPPHKPIYVLDKLSKIVVVHIHRMDDRGALNLWSR